MVIEWIKKIYYQLWVLYGYLGWKVGGTSAKVTVIITYYYPVRHKHINAHVRNLLKCSFIERVILLNHNPQYRIEDGVSVVDARLVFLNSSTRRGSGYRFLVANQYPSQYTLVIDDDILLFPRQVKKLLTALIAEPDCLHGFSGMIHKPDGSLEQLQKQNRRVDYLCETYAFTREQLQRFLQYWEQLSGDTKLARWIETTGDFVMLSRAGKQKPQIHSIGHVLRCPTFNQQGIAIHREQSFLLDLQAGLTAIEALQP